MPTNDEFIAAAERAAPKFGLEPDSVTLMSHSENVVCEVVAADGHRSAMRLHRVGYNTRDELRSEVAWVESLDASGVRVPTARPATSGDYYVAQPVGDEVRQVGVVEWVEGEPLSVLTAGSEADRDRGLPSSRSVFDEERGEKADYPGAEGDAVVAHYERIGAVAAQIRQHYADWTPPDGFVRRAWDHDGLVGDSPLWGRFWEVPGLSQQQRRLFANCRHVLSDALEQLPTTPDRYGMIHADLHLGNLMSDGNELTVIDFDDSGYGWFAHELAVALHPVLDEPWENDAKQALLRGYRAVHELSDEEEALIDTFLTVRCLMLIGWLNDRRELPVFEYFDDLAAQAEAAAARYLATHG